MMRQFVPLACLGTALLPAGALALGWRACYAPRGPAPVVCYLPPVVYFPACPPPVEFIAPAPSATPAPAAPAPQSPAAPKVTQDPPARPEPAKPDAPVPKAPVGPTPAVPRTGLDAPEVRPADAVRIPATVPVIPVTPSAPLAQPRAVEPPTTPDPVRLPPLVPRVPGNEGGLPPLKIEPPTVPRTSSSSPLADRRPFEVVPVAGGEVPAPGALRSVGIFNHTDADVTLTVEGETVTLPARSYVTAAVPRKFAWKLGAGESQSTEVPPGAPGVEIVLRR